MEAIGLFGNDVNNVLGGILACSEMLFDETPKKTPLKRHAQNVLIAATRGCDLVYQIFASTRGHRGNGGPADVRRRVAETFEFVRSSLPALLWERGPLAGRSRAAARVRALRREAAVTLQEAVSCTLETIAFLPAAQSPSAEHEVDRAGFRRRQ